MTWIVPETLPMGDIIMKEKKNRITFGRKFLGCVIATVLFGAIYFVTLVRYPSAISPAGTIAFGGFCLTTWFAYIGGNVWQKWIQSKGGGAPDPGARG